MQLDPSLPTQVDVFVDWMSLFRGLRPPTRMGTTNSDPTVAADVLLDFRELLVSLLDPADVYHLDTRLYGGFVDNGGRETTEARTLNQAVASIRWSVRATNNIRIGELQVVDALLLEQPGLRLTGLYIPEETINEAQLKTTSKACSCRWQVMTRRWLAMHGARRVCPQCAHSPTRSTLVRPTQKLVDNLIGAHALRIATNQVSAEAPAETWICTGDADLVPTLGQIAAAGAKARWLQTVENKRLGYVALLADLGVRTHVLRRTPQ